MGVNPFPSAAHLSAYISQHEIPLRLQHHAALPVVDIFRYGAIIGSECHFSAVLDRCMTSARLLVQEAEEARCSFASGTVIGAAELTAGSGRFQRFWHAPPGGLWFSLVLVNTLSSPFSRLLPLMAGLACAETVAGFGLPAQLKWVNDVMLGGKKVAGILTESQQGISGEEYIFIGIGLNVNNRDFPLELSAIATSMATISGYEIDLAQVACDLLAKLSWYYGLLVYLDESGEEDTVPFMDKYRQASHCVGRRVSYGFDVQQQPLYEAEVKAIADDGSLVMEIDGVEIRESGGEILFL